MCALFIPEGYHSPLDLYKTQKAISFIKQDFQERLSSAMRLKRVSAPLFVTEASGLNDNLNGTERPVSFDVPAIGESVQVVHSLAKWKRMALHEYHFYVGNGLYTDMNAIRRDEELDNSHSIYVDQWDWERVITREERTLDYLISVAQKIVNVICDTSAGLANGSWQNYVMILVSFVLMYLAIVKKFEPLLLLPIAFGMFLINLPGAYNVLWGKYAGEAHGYYDVTLESRGLLWYLFYGVEEVIYPPLIFLGIGAMTDFGPLISNPKSMILGAAAQFGIF